MNLRKTSEERFDVVDEQDCVIGSATRNEVHARGLLHRAVNIFVVNSQGQLLLQKRTATKDQFPLCYTSSASGHVDAGETYDEAARRELAEELGMKTEIKFLQQFPAGPETANEHSALYLTVTDEPPQFDPVEIEAGAFYEMPTIADLIERSPEEFTPPFQVLFDWYVRNQ